MVSWLLLSNVLRVGFLVLQIAMMGLESEYFECKTADEIAIDEREDEENCGKYAPGVFSTFFLRTPMFAIVICFVDLLAVFVLKLI